MKIINIFQNNSILRKINHHLPLYTDYTVYIYILLQYNTVFD